MNKLDGQHGQVVLMFIFCLFTLLIVILLPGSRFKKIMWQHDVFVLNQAKTSLIAWTASRYSNNEGQHKKMRLREMVMPDKESPHAKKGVGIQDSTVRIGRLPWKTLGIPPLLDSHGEFLWYTVSGRFRDNSRYKKTLSCHNLKQFHLYDSKLSIPVIAEDIVAVVIAPHQSLIGQTRHTLLQQTLAHQYIEAGPHSISRQHYYHFIHGEQVENGRIVSNDSVGVVMCRALEKVLHRREARELE